MRKFIDGWVEAQTNLLDGPYDYFLGGITFGIIIWHFLPWWACLLIFLVIDFKLVKSRKDDNNG